MSKKRSRFIINIDLFGATDTKNNSNRVVKMDQPELGLSREFLLHETDSTQRDAYLAYMKEAAVLYGAEEAAAASAMEKVFAFEKRLAEASLPREERRDATKLYNPFNVADIERLEGHPPSWREYIQVGTSRTFLGLASLDGALLAV